MKKQTKTDETDAHIIRVLLKEARTSFKEIARSCNVRANLVRTRYNRLKQEGIITGDVMEIRPDVFGYSCSATLRLRVNLDKTEGVSNQLKNIPEIRQIAEGVGRKNLLCFVITRNLTDLNRIIEQIKGLNGVTDAEADLWVKTDRVAFPENLQLIAEEH